MKILRPYQERAIQRVIERLLAGARRVLLVLPTGGGKSLTAAEMIRRFTAETGRRALWLTNRQELLAQAVDAIQERGVSVGTITADGTLSTQAPCVVAALDTLVSRGLRPSADLIVFDEAHHAAAQTYAALLKDYPDAIIVGLTATPERGDGIGLGGHFDALVVGATVRELTDLGVLVPLRVRRPKAPLPGGTIAQGVADAYLEHAPGTQAIVFSPSVALAHEHAAELTMAGALARCIHGEMPSAERALYVAAFRRGDVRALVNVAVLCEGFDAPAVSTCILARGASTTGGFDQIVGRVVRSSPGKTEALLVDLRGASHIHGLPIDGRDYSLSGIGIRRTGAAECSFCRVCGQVFDVPGPCPDCGHAPEPATLRVRKEELKPYDWITPMRKLPADKRYATLLNWVRTARSKGYKTGWVFGRYRAVFGVPPTRADLTRAFKEAAQ